MRNKNLYRPPNLFHLLNRFLLLFLIVYITAIPGFKIVIDQYNLKIEQCELCGEEDLKEKEIITDDMEDMDQAFYDSKSHASIYFNNFLSEFNLDLHLPPPKNVHDISSILVFLGVEAFRQFTSILV
jgi:hypothetical protein